MYSYVIRTNGYDVYPWWSTVSPVMINSIIFMIEFIWFNIIRDTLLLFEQFLYVSLLSLLVPGSFFFMEWILNWLSGFYLSGINIVQSVIVVGQWNLPKLDQKKIVGNVYGKNVVGKPINQVMVSYIGLKDDEKKWKKIKKSLDFNAFYS